MNEKRLSSLAVGFLSGSMLFAMLGLLMIFGAASVAAGDGDVISSPLFWKGTALFAAYALSLYAVASVPGKSRRRRLISWAFSVVFHGAVIAYVAVELEFGFLVALPLMAEVAAVLLSVAGLTLAVREHIHA
ncbi:MAG: hypothetical protein ACE5K9_12615 [Candidatus Methylomirabilales bacterium]